MSDPSYHDLALALGEEREVAVRLRKQLAHLESLLLAARRGDQQAAVQEQRLQEQGLELKRARATIAELEQRLKKLERKMPWWRRLRKRE